MRINGLSSQHISHSPGRAIVRRVNRLPVNDGPLETLQRRYRSALSGAVVAKARYLAQAGEAFASAASVERARWRWQRIESSRARLAAEIDELAKNSDVVDCPKQRELRV